LVAADGEFLYVGFRCYDSQPDAIEALETRRDAGMGRDDHVAVQLDPYHDHQTFFTFYANIADFTARFHGVPRDGIAIVHCGVDCESAQSGAAVE
jgi:hypothetical protein